MSGHLTGFTNLLFVVLAFAAGLGLGFVLWAERPVRETPEALEVTAAEPGVGPVISTEPSPLDQLKAEIEAAISAEAFEEAMALVMRAELLAESEEELIPVEELLFRAVTAQVNLLAAAGQDMAIDALYEELTFRMPERATFFIRLAEHRIATGNGEAALPVLAQIENHATFGEQARNLAAQILAPLPREPVADLPLERRGDQFLVEALIDQQQTVVLLIDTGASMTTLSPGVLRNLGYAMEGERALFTTANGPVEAAVVQISSLMVDTAEVPDIKVGALTIRGIDGLLGMNFLRGFEFTIDQQTNRLQLYKKSL